VHFAYLFHYSAYSYAGHSTTVVVSGKESFKRIKREIAEYITRLVFLHGLCTPLLSVMNAVAVREKIYIYIHIHFLKKDRPPKRLTSRGGSRSAVCQPHLLTRRTSVILRDLYEHQKFHVKRCLSQYQPLVKIRESLLAFWPRFSNRLSLQKKIYILYIYIYN